MSESHRTKNSNRRLFLLSGFLLAVAFAGFVHVRTLQLPPVVLFLHEEGTVSEGERAGKRIQPHQIDVSPFDEDNPFHSRKVILEAPSGTPLVAWNSTFEHLLINGVNSFELRLGKETLAFHFPALDGDAHLARGTTPLEMIDLRKDPSADYRRGKSNPDVLVLADESTTVDSFLRAAVPHRKIGKSLMVDGVDSRGLEGGGIPMMIRRRDEDALNRQPKYSLLSRIRMAFQFN